MTFDIPRNTIVDPLLVMNGITLYLFHAMMFQCVWVCVGGCVGVPSTPKWDARLVVTPPCWPNLEQANPGFLLRICNPPRVLNKNPKIPELYLIQGQSCHL